jgi:uncharacterized protein YyaL (SSP411 family)
MQKVIHFFIFITVSVFALSFTPAKKAKIKWLTLTQVQEEYKKSPKPIIIDVYTKWCGWCKVMDKETYSKASVIDYINKNYYAVKFDAEQNKPVIWQDKTYNFNEKYTANGFAVYLLQGNMGYPTTVLLSAPDAIPAPLSGYLKPSELEPPLKFFGDGNYKTQNFPEFMKTFKTNW